ncbi:transposase domain-containing protein [Bacteroides acidifaciens]|uniref:transposase domain-containing protein n=1 Tax=Bacteroides acidifaciens TaxID=85831 RepID=UPI00214A041C|nr:transposase domain-containing protein [Bacteroides acidifaciens]MCR2007283.1 transposase domain-containing protein [Bacteroides acidifaciens]
MSVICSLLATCKAHKVKPRNYLNDVITKMLYMKKATYDELLQMLPHKWQEIQKE